MKTFDQYLLESTSNFRCGITLPFQEVTTTFSNIKGIHNISIPQSSYNYWQSASGSANTDKNKAIMGAIGESLERYSAYITKFLVKKKSEIKVEKILSYDDFSLFSNKQYLDKNFKWKKVRKEDTYFGDVYNMYNNEKYWVPQELIGLGAKKGEAKIPSTSTGLAAHFDKNTVILSAIHELLERDALTVYWLNSLGGREIMVDEKYNKLISEKGGKVYFFDITQDWNPHPVILVCGYIKQRNKKRISMGVACRENYEKAIEKAFIEWNQGVVFAGFYDIYHPGLELKNTSDLKDFDEHAVYYTLYPELWDKVPIITNRVKYQIDKNKNNYGEGGEILENLLEKLKGEKIDLFYRDLSSADIKEIGLMVVRVLSPQLSLIHGDENTPFLGGRTNDVKWRYGDFFGTKISFPNTYPHPLG